MTSRHRHSLLAGLLALVLAAGLVASGDALAKKGSGKRGDDHDDVFRGRLAGEVLPLEEVLQALSPADRRRVVEIEFEYDDGIPVYEVEYVNDRGRLVEMTIDARSGAVLEFEFD